MAGGTRIGGGDKSGAARTVAGQPDGGDVLRIGTADAVDVAGDVGLATTCDVVVRGWLAVVVAISGMRVVATAGALVGSGDVLTNACGGVSGIFASGKLMRAASYVIGGLPVSPVNAAGGVIVPFANASADGDGAATVGTGATGSCFVDDGPTDPMDDALLPDALLAAGDGLATLGGGVSDRPADGLLYCSSNA